jgi:DNA-binding beta-propeller fold protein YncE
MIAGRTYVIAGGGTAKGTDDGIPATSAYPDPYGVAVDSAGNVLIADPSNLKGQFNSLIRVVAARTRTYYGVAVTPSGAILVLDLNRVRRISQ